MGPLQGYIKKLPPPQQYPFSRWSTMIFLSMDIPPHHKIEEKNEKFDLADTRSRTRDQISPNAHRHQKMKKIKKNIFFFRFTPSREPNPRPNTLKRTPKWPNIGNGPYTRVYKKILPPPHNTPSQGDPQWSFYLWTFPHTTKLKKKMKKWPCRHPESNPGPNFTKRSPIPKNKKNQEKKICSILPTPGIDPTTKHFEADAKMT